MDVQETVTTYNGAVPVTIGADPELFVLKGDQFISGHTFKMGTKKKPRKLEHCHVQNDGLALEFNVNPSRFQMEFLMNVKHALRNLDEEVKKIDPECSIRAIPTAHFDKDYLAKLPASVRALGCNPDFNGYTLQENPPPDEAKSFRTGAGHVHIGWCENERVQDPEHFVFCARLARELDYYLGLPSLLWDKDQERRALYGQAGAFRPKPYGMEYRVLSNKWLNTENLVRKVFINAMNAYHRCTSSHEGYVEKYGELARNCINQGITDWNDRYPELAKEVL